MVRAWVKDHDTVTDEKLPHQKFPEEFITLKELYNICGVEFLKFDPLTFKEDEELKKLRELRGFSFEDEITVSRESLSDYDKLNIFLQNTFTLLKKFVLFLVVLGILMLETPLTNGFEYIKAQRYYVGKPCWSQYERPADDLESRKMYLQRIEKGFSSTSVGI
ncbi:unnamed protein product [Diamesa tonsa]